MVMKLIVNILEGLSTGLAVKKSTVMHRIRTDETISTKEKAFLLDWIKPAKDDVPGLQNAIYALFDLGTIEDVKKGVAFFSKVSYYEFSKVVEGEEILFKGSILDKYEDIRLPKRATKGSAGYDFFSPFEFELKPGETIKIPTGIRCGMDYGYVLQMYPRSGFGFKYRCQLDNTVGIIDSDYFNSDNEGHIMVKITNDSKSGKVLKVEKGEAFCQGIFLQYGLIIGDNTDGIRNGGFGSTSMK